MDKEISIKQTWESKVESTDINTTGGYTYDQVMHNKNVSKDAKFWLVISNTINDKEPRYLFRSSVAESWEFFDNKIINPIRNTNQIYIRFLKVIDFVQPSNHFREHKCYTYAPDNTLMYEQYWDDLENKIENGFEVDGVLITGRHFFTINFARFQAIPVDEFGRATSKRKTWTFLRFIDVQFYLFHELEECLLTGKFSNLKDFLEWFPLAEEEDYDLLVLQSFVASKARRKGWSAVIGVGVFNYNFTFVESSNNFIVAGEKAHYGPIRKAVSNTKTFLDAHTPWVRRTEVMGQREHLISSVKVKDEYGVETEVGYLSELKYESFKDNPFKGIGECYSPDTQVVKFNGDIVRIKDLKRGDYLLGPDGKKRKVLHKHIGIDNLTTFSQKKGIDFTVNSRHLLYGKLFKTSKPITVSTSEFLNWSEKDQKLFRTLRPNKFTIDNNTLEIDPYFYGLWLGDGDSSRAAIASMDIEIETYLQKLALEYNLSLLKKYLPNNKASHYTLGGLKGNYKEIYVTDINNKITSFTGFKSIADYYGLSTVSWKYFVANPKSKRTIKTLKRFKIKNIVKTNNKSNIIYNWLRDKKLLFNKHVINELKFTDEKTRLNFLAGFIDSDGSINLEKRIYTISQSNKQILEDTAFIARSLGFYAKVNKYKRTSGLGKKFNNYYKLTITGDIWDIPVKIERKKSEKFKHSVEILESSIKIKNQYYGEYVGIEVDGDNLFLLKDFTISHNSAYVINIEEPGKFSNLLETYPVSIQPLVRDGETIIGTCIAGGTSGDLESGGSLGIYTMMYAPKAFGFKEYDNIYEETPQNTKSGWFIDDLWYSPLKVLKKTILEINDSEHTKKLLEHWEGKYINTVDEQGNSYRYFSDLVLSVKRVTQKNTSIVSYRKFITQQPKYLSEAFLVDESSPFDTATVKEALGILKAKDRNKLETGTFALRPGDVIKWKRDFNLFPVDEYPFKRDDTEGCWVLYEHPVKEKNTRLVFKDDKTLPNEDKYETEEYEEIASWRYLAATDPIDWGSGETSDNDKNKHSMAATYIIDSLTRNIVAEYIGRPRTSEDYFEQLWRGVEFYNAILLYENNLKGLFSYFKLKNKTYLLANEPESLKDRAGYKSNNRIKGFHATVQANSYGRELLHRWSLEEVPINQNTETGEVSFMPRMFNIPSIGLLQEMQFWNSKGNFDRISSMGALMILLFDREYNVEDEESKKKANQFAETGIFMRVKQKMLRTNPFKELKI